MKKIYTILVCLCLLAGFVACEKDKDFVLTTLTVQNETITPSYGSATIDCSFKADATISEAFVQYSLSSSFAKYDVAKMTEEKGKYAALLLGLQDNTTYYIRYAVSNKYSSAVTEEVMEFQTLQCTAPTIALDSIADVWDNRSKAYLHLTFDGGASVTDMGICWSKQTHPTIEDIHKSTKDTVAVLDMTDLQPNTTYYIRAYAVNRVGVSYSEEQEFTTYSLPEVRTEEVADIQENTALLSATLVFDGNDTATIKGFCWSDKAEPTIEANHIAIDTTSVHYTYLLPELLPATEYHVRAYAQNKIGVVYGEEKTFTTTKDVVSPTVTTAAITQITETGAVAGGNVTSDGGASVTERGVVYATTQNPTITNTKVTSGTGTGSFTCNLTGLQPNTTYYVRAYAENSKGTAYGEEVTFTTKANANISDPTGTENGYGYVDLGLSVKWATMNVGATKPEEYGDYFAWGETQPKSTYNWSTYKWCNGSDNTQTKYNTNSSYGTVDNKTQLELSDDAARANWGGSWRMPTYAELTELCENCNWTWTTQNGVYGYKVTSKKSGYTNKSIFLPAAGCRDDSGLYRAGSLGYYWSSSLYTGYPYYAYELYFSSDGVNRDGSIRYYGQSVRPVLGENEVEGTTPTVTTTTVTQITETAAVAGGNVTSDGGASVTERGVVYATTQNPTTADNKVSNGSGMGTFTCNLTDLQPNTTYYVRAYATNEVGTAYGEEVSFTTQEQSSTPNNGTENGYAYVDLGLSVKWATCNVGANNPEDYGSYFAWGETTTKSTYKWSTYKWCNGSSSTLTKYNTSSDYGTVDNKTQLDLSDDAARANWGGSWRMPTDAEWTELREQCTWTWTAQNGKNGYKVTSKTNGNSIFLPAAGYRNDSSLSSAGSYGGCWSSSLDTVYPDSAWSVNFNSDNVSRNYSTRYFGFSVRPVCQ